MKTIILAALLILLAACGPSASPSATASANPTAISSPTAKPSPATPSPTLLYAVLEANGTANAWTYNTVAIAGLDGYARAKTTFAPIAAPAIGCFGTVTPQSAHVAAGKVFFADGKGVIRSLAVNGTVAVATTFPLTSAQQMLSFSVSPDGTQVLGTIYTLPANLSACNGAWSGTFTFDAYSATSGGSSRLVYHDSWSTSHDVLALTGWDAIGPIGTYPTVWASQGGGPGSTLGVAVRVDPSTMRPGAALTDPTKCIVWNSIASGAFVCLGTPVMTSGGTADQRVSQPVSVRQGGDVEAWHATVVGQNSPFGPFLSPDGQRVAICCNDLDLSNSHELVIGNGTSSVNIAKGFYAAGWLDSRTLVGTQDSRQLAYVVLDSPGIVVSMGFAGLFLGTVAT